MISSMDFLYLQVLSLLSYLFFLFTRSHKRRQDKVVFYWKLITGYITKEVFFSLWSPTPKIVTVSTGRSSPLPYPPLPPHPDPSDPRPHPSREEAPPQPSRTVNPQSVYHHPVTKEQKAWRGGTGARWSNCALPSRYKVHKWSDTASPLPDPTSGSG